MTEDEYSEARRTTSSRRSATTGPASRPPSDRRLRGRQRHGPQAQGLISRTSRPPKKADPRGDFHSRSACLARPDRSSRDHRGAVRHQRARRLRVQSQFLDARARARPPGRDADHPRGADGRWRRPVDRADEPGGHDHPPARGCIRRRRGRGDDRGRQEHRRPDPGRGRRRDASADRGLRAASAAAGALRGCPGEHVRRRGQQGDAVPDARIPSLQATPTASPTNASDPVWITPALQAEFLAYDCADENNDPAERAGRRAAHHLLRRRLGQVHPRPGRARRIVDLGCDLRPPADQRRVGGQPDVRRRGHRDVRRHQPAPLRRDRHP